jgi:hypothetical protein
MKTSRVNDYSGNETTGKNFVSWNKDTQAQLLRVEWPDGNFFLFPYAHLSVVKFEQNGESDVLNLCFAKHEIQITGKHLRELGLAFQKLAVDWVKESPSRYSAIANSDSVCIASIKVSEIQAPQ